MHYAHSGSRSDSSHWEPLRTHIQDVARRAGEYADVFGAAQEARLAGLLHDLGKYGGLFQQRLRGKARGVDHWSVGAWVAIMKYKQTGIASAIAIQGHHVGIQKVDRNALRELDPDRLQSNHPLGLRLSDPDWRRLVELCEADGVHMPEPDGALRSVYEGINSQSPAGSMLDIRMLYSALVDADFVETEAHFQGSPGGRKRHREHGPALNAERDLSCLRVYLEGLAAESRSSSQVNMLRSDLLRVCLQESAGAQGLYTLTAPTGTGKTLSMLAFALNHAAKHRLRRVVVVVPYLTVIEQTVLEYRKALAGTVPLAEMDRHILEHHSLAGIRGLNSKRGSDQDSVDEMRRQARLLTENWDAPIVVTTSVQLLESLLSNRPSACRRLHRLASSVILLDEIQTLPVSVVIPTLATLSRLAERYRTSVVLATATQPAFTHLDAHVRTYCKTGWQPKEIVPTELNLFERARRVEVEWPDMDRPTSWTDVAQWLTGQDQVLCVVNLKKHALRLFVELRTMGGEGLYHLSTSMCPAHRKAVLQQVRSRLKRRERCRLVSTQCIEAGVDLDFPVVYRAFGPLDAIAQAAGRCNRNGGAETAKVFVFLPEEERYPDGTYQQAADVTRMLLKKRGTDPWAIHKPDWFNRYYRDLYDIVKPQNRKPELLDAVKLQDFARVAELYRVIEKDALNVLVPYDDPDNPGVFQQLEEEARQTGLHREWIAKARPYTIGLFKPRSHDPVATYLVPVTLGARRENAEDWFIYTQAGHYDPNVGLVPPGSMECLIG